MIQSPRTVLLTGFGPFGTVEQNPSQTLALALNGLKFDGWRCHTMVLDVSYRRAIQQLLARVEELKPACVIMTGVARSATALRVERQAVNCASSIHADIDGEVGHNRPLEVDLPTDLIRQSIWDIDTSMAHVLAAGFPIYDSMDAGGYVCNASYFQALGELNVPVVFVHVPPETPDWTHERLVGAVSALLLSLEQLFPSASPDLD